LRQTCPRPGLEAPQAVRAIEPHPHYRLACGDVVEVRFDTQPQWDALVAVSLDGRLPLGLPAEPRVEGLTVSESRDLLAQSVQIPPDAVQLRLVEPRGQYLFVHGPIRGRLRIVPYQGPETVLDFLKRISGLPPGTQLGQIYVVRPGVAQGQRPQVFRCDVRSALYGLPTLYNVPLQPGDLIYLGETGPSVLARFLPDWLAPLYCRLLGLWPESWFFPSWYDRLVLERRWADQGTPER
jgi:protein involved in polysaccharide export with SLBB domain